MVKIYHQPTQNLREFEMRIYNKELLYSAQLIFGDIVCDAFYEHIPIPDLDSWEESSFDDTCIICRADMQVVLTFVNSKQVAFSGTEWMHICSY